MTALDAAMHLYPYVFHPTVVLGAGLLALVYLEWVRRDADRSALWRRVGGVIAAGVLALAPTFAYVAVTGRGLFAVTKGNGWQVDALVAVGVLVVAGTAWSLWRYFDWGPLVPGYAAALALVTVPYAALSPFWNVSGHVALSLTPALYLTLVDRRFWPTLAVPVVMVPNRVYLAAHTPAQAVGGFALTAALVIAAFGVQTGGSFRIDPESPAT